MTEFEKHSAGAKLAGMFLWVLLAGAACLSGLIWLMSASYVGLIGTAVSVAFAGVVAAGSKGVGGWLGPLMGILSLGITYVVAVAAQ